MDRRFLSRPEVVSAASNFVCIRLMTYESASEAEVLKSYWRRGAELENTVFTILDPKGNALIRGSRSPKRVFGDSHDMASYMNKVASQYGYRADNNHRELPLVKSVRLALNVAACDQRPLVIVVGESDYVRKVLANRIAGSAWSDELTGKFVYASARGSSTSLSKIRGGNSMIRGYLIVAPDRFGTEGRVLRSLDTQSGSRDFKRVAQSIASSYRPDSLERRSHVLAGHRKGVHWKTAIPVTDRRSLQAAGRPIGR